MEARSRRQLTERERDRQRHAQQIQKNLVSLTREWKKEIERRAKYGGDGTEACRELARRHLRDIHEISEKKEEIQRLCKAWYVFEESYEDIIHRAIARKDYVAGQRR